MPMDETLKSKAPASPGHRRSLTSLRHFVPGQLLEVTMRCFQSHFLLVPSEELERTFLGVLGKAQQLYKMKICYFVSHFRQATRQSQSGAESGAWPDFA